MGGQVCRGEHPPAHRLVQSSRQLQKELACAVPACAARASERQGRAPKRVRPQTERGREVAPARPQRVAPTSHCA
eukprot:4112022-Alexandrium_andersonii.AAC.1